MTQTVYGVCLTRDGLASWQELVQGRDRPELRFKAWATPADLLLPVQDDKLIVDHCHDGVERGRVLYLERWRNGDVVAVAEVDDDLLPEVRVKVADKVVSIEHDLYWSVSRIGPNDGYLLTGLSLTPTPARISARPVRFVDGGVHLAAFRSSDQAERELLERANRYDTKRHGPLVVVDRDPPSLHQAASFELASRSAPIEYRSAQIASVSPAGRTLELVVAPVEEPARVVIDDRWVTEVYAPDAFAGAEKNPGRIKLNRDHRISDVIGVLTSVDPYALEGCVAVAKIADTERGREAIALCQDQCLDVSAGFRTKPNGVQWPSRDVRLVTAAELHHVALVADGAYGAAARVTAVRDREPAVY